VENDFFKDFLQTIRALEAHNVDYVLVGGFAVILHGLPRLTEDMDIFIRPTFENVERLKRALEGAFGDKSVEEISAEELGKYPVIRYGTPNGFAIDIMAKVGEMFRFEDLKSEILLVEGQKVKVATAETLFKMKKDTLRETDKTDAAYLAGLIEKKGRTS